MDLIKKLKGYNNETDMDEQSHYINLRVTRSSLKFISKILEINGKIVKKLMMSKSQN